MFVPINATAPVDPFEISPVGPSVGRQAQHRRSPQVRMASPTVSFEMAEYNEMLLRHETVLSFLPGLSYKMKKINREMNGDMEKIFSDVLTNVSVDVAPPIEGLESLSPSTPGTEDKKRKAASSKKSTKNRKQLTQKVYDFEVMRDLYRGFCLNRFEGGVDPPSVALQKCQPYSEEYYELLAILQMYEFETQQVFGGLDDFTTMPLPTAATPNVSNDHTEATVAPGMSPTPYQVKIAPGIPDTPYQVYTKAGPHTGSDMGILPQVTFDEADISTTYAAAGTPSLLQSQGQIIPDERKPAAVDIRSSKVKQERPAYLDLMDMIDGSNDDFPNMID
jgi:hypothetical protein